MDKELTPKEQKFAELCVSLGNQTEAYRQAYKPAKTLSKEDKQAFYRVMNQTKNTDKLRALESIAKMMGLNEPEVVEHNHTVKTYKTNWG